MRIPYRQLSRFSINSSIKMLNKYGESILPCLVPFVTLKNSLYSPFKSTVALIDLYQLYNKRQLYMYNDWCDEWLYFKAANHYSDVIRSTMAFQITSLTIVYPTVYSRRRSKKTSKLRVTVLCVGNSPVNSPHKGPVARKMFHYDDVIAVWINKASLHFSLSGGTKPLHEPMLTSHKWGLWHLYESYFTAIVQANIFWNDFEIHPCQITAAFPSAELLIYIKPLHVGFCGSKVNNSNIQIYWHFRPLCVL